MKSPLCSSQIFTTGRHATNTDRIHSTREEAGGTSFKLAFQFAAQVSRMLQSRIKRGQSSRVEPKPESSRHTPPDIFDAKLPTAERGSVTFAYIRIYVRIPPQPAAAFVVSYPRFTLQQSSIATFRPLNRISRISSRAEIKSMTDREFISRDKSLAESYIYPNITDNSW